MASFTVTSSNWNDPAFWASLSVSDTGNSIDFSALPPNFSVDFDPDSGEVIISDGTSTFRIGDGTQGDATDAEIGGGLFEYFTTITGSQGNDTLRGSERDDTIEGGAGSDDLQGGGGDDALFGGDGDDSLSGGAGNDTIEGGAGADTLSGGTGGGAPDWTDFGNNGNVTGTTGTDYFRYSAPTNANATVSMGDGSGNLQTGDGSPDYLLINSTNRTNNLEVNGFDYGTDKIVLLEMPTSFSFNANPNSLSGTITYANGNTQAFQINHTKGTAGFTFEDVFTTEMPVSGSGNDSLLGGGGDDTFLVEDGFGDDTIVGGEGGTDDDLIDLSALSGPVRVEYDATGEGGWVSDGTNTIAFSEIERIVGTDHADMIQADAATSGIDVDAGGGDDSVSGGSGDDTLRGGDGNDRIEGDEGADFIEGGAGDDVLVGYDAKGTYSGYYATDTDDGSADTLSGGDGDDLLLGGGGDDSLDGGADRDMLIGGTGDDRLDGGEGDDLLSGGAGDDVFVVSGGNDIIWDFNFGNSGTLNDGDDTNNDFIDLSGYYDHLSELYADQADDGLLNQSNTTDSRGNSVDYSDNAQFGDGSIEMRGASADNTSFTSENTGVVCFTTGTAIRTPLGDVPIEDLRIGDLVTTLDNGPQPIRWIGRRSLDRAELLANPDMRPILIRKGVLGCARDLLVSPQHGLLVGRYGDHLARAKHLAGAMPGVRVAHGRRSVTYVHLMFDAHQIIIAEAAPSESFYPGPMAFRMMDQGPRAELATIFPEIVRALAASQNPRRIYGETSRQFLAKKRVADLAA